MCVPRVAWSSTSTSSDPQRREMHTFKIYRRNRRARVDGGLTGTRRNAPCRIRPMLRDDDAQVFAATDWHPIAARDERQKFLLALLVQALGIRPEIPDHLHTHTHTHTKQAALVASVLALDGIGREGRRQHGSAVQCRAAQCSGAVSRMSRAALCVPAYRII